MNQQSPLEEWAARKIGLAPGRLTRQELEQYQWRKLSETLRHATSASPFYHQHFAGLLAGDVSSLTDFARLPFTSEVDLRENGPAMLCLSQSQISRVVSLETSCTVGAPKRLWFTAEEQAQTKDFFSAGMSLVTRPGDKVLVLLPGERPGSVGDLLAHSLQAMGVEAIAHGPVRCLAETLRIIRSQRVTSLVGIPVQVLALARYSLTDGGEAISLNSVLLSTDYAADSLVRTVESSWNCQVFDHYGMTEMGLGGAVECEQHNGLHLREADLLFEIVDPDSGVPLAEGCEGEVVFTTLTRTGMPLIRYRTGDWSRFLPGACRCGSVLKRLDKVRSRKREDIELPAGGAIRLADFDEALFAVAGVIDFSLEVLQAGSRLQLKLDLLTVGADPSVEVVVAKQLAALAQLEAARLEGGLELTVCTRSYAGSLPALNGKRRIRRG